MPDPSTNPLNPLDLHDQPSRLDDAGKSSLPAASTGMVAPAAPVAPHGPQTPRFAPGDIVANFKRETVADNSQRYLYRVLAYARHTETDEELVVYQALYPPFGTWCRPRTMFESEVDRAKYPDIKQRWRFEKVDPQEP